MTDPSAAFAVSHSVLVAALLRLAGAGFAAGLFGFGFPAGDLALRVRLLLLRAPFLAHVLVATERARCFLDLALHAFDDALGARLRASVLVCHLLHPPW